MMKNFAVAAFLVAACLVSAPQQAHAQATTTQPEMSCFVNSWTLAQYTACHFIGEGVPAAVITTPAGVYTVVCSYAAGCSFSFASHNPIRPRVIEP